MIKTVNLKNKKVTQVIINDNEVSEEGFLVEFTDAVTYSLGLHTQEKVNIKLSVINCGKIQGNIAIDSKKKPDFKGNFRKYNHIKLTEQKRN